MGSLEIPIIIPAPDNILTLILLVNTLHLKPILVQNITAIKIVCIAIKYWIYNLQFAVRLATFPHYWNPNTRPGILEDPPHMEVAKTRQFV